jgi:CheY-like chemotaxis protein
MFREPDDEATTRSVHILHAEDDALVASAVREALRGEGWRVSTYADGPSALGEIEGPEHYDLLIIDKQLPGADGLELVVRARELPHRQHVPVIVLSASDIGREARRAGASAFLRKPEDMPALAETIARLLARRPKQGTGVPSEET